MECLFAGFDYSVIDQTGNAKTVARNEDSAFLTKHLRAYGGTGEYEGYKIGRSLRDISFSGKGLVSKPANPRSIILDSSRAFSVNEQYTISNNVPKGEFNMSDKNLPEKLVDETTVEVVASSETVTVDVDSLNKEVAERVSLLETTLAEKDSALKTFEERVANLEASLLIKEKELAAMDSEMKDMKKKEKNASRKNSMVKSGFDESEAEEILPLYDNVDDAAFETILAVYKKKMAKVKPAFKEDLSKDEKNESTNPKAEVIEVKASEEEVNASLFAGVNSTEATLVDASDVNDELEVTRASVAEWLTENVLRK